MNGKVYFVPQHISVIFKICKQSCGIRKGQNSGLLVISCESLKLHILGTIGHRVMKFSAFNFNLNLVLQQIKKIKTFKISPMF